ncbi:MAG: GntR family transcriptional regulator, partial [Planctomycetota bacterium]
SPLPLYAQIAESLRRRIAAGELQPGDFLEPLREAANKYQVNLHTVRHAYAALARQGLVRTRKPKGTEVIARPGGGLAAMLEQFIERARIEHELSPGELVDELSRWLASRADEGGQVTVLECSQGECVDLGQQIEARWQVKCAPAPLPDLQKLPAGLLVATPFHFNDLRLHWPERLGEVHFVTTSPDPDLARRLHEFAPEDKTLLLVANDAATAEVIAADLRAILPEGRFRIETCIVTEASEAFEFAGEVPILLPPSQWGQLSVEQRSDPRCFLVRYLFDTAELRALAQKLGWSRRQGTNNRKVS